MENKRTKKGGGMDQLALVWDRPENLSGDYGHQGDIFRSLFENNPLPLWFYDIDSLEFLAVNDAAIAHYGFSLKEFLSMTVNDIRPSEDIGAFLDLPSRHEACMSRTITERHKKKDGTIITAEVTFHAIKFGTRNARFMLVNDITDRRIAEEALRRSEEKYRDLFENANDAIFIVDSDLRYRDVNKKAVELLGYSKKDFLAMKILDLLPPDQVPRAKAEMEKLKHHGSYEKFVGKLRTRDGRWLDVEVNSSAIVADGRIVGSRDIVRDITDRKRMEDELLRAQKLESIGLLAGGIAHDFNNLLTAMLGNITLAKMDARPGESVHERLTETEKAVSRAQDLTQQLLTFSKGGAPVMKTISLKEFINETVSFSLRGSKTLSIFFIPDDLWPVNADEGQLSQVFNNIVINANQAMPNGGKLRVFCSNDTIVENEVPSLPAGRYVKVTFADSGIGIPGEHMEKIFDPYFTTKNTGNGIGLATSYSIIKRHGGHISVESEVGNGATFHVYLPVSEQEAGRESPGERGSRGGAGRILIVDDEEMIRDVTAKILDKLGYESTSASDGQEALYLYGETKKNGKSFDAVIMDLTIPGGMGGKEATAKLLKMDPHAKVIVSSGYSKDSILGRFQEYGFVASVSKPYTIEKLSETVRKVMEGNRPGASFEL
jgi:PAS domain S-box-containing protein